MTDLKQATFFLTLDYLIIDGDRGKPPSISRLDTSPGAEIIKKVVNCLNINLRE